MPTLLLDATFLENLVLHVKMLPTHHIAGNYTILGRKMHKRKFWITSFQNKSNLS